MEENVNLLEQRTRADWGVDGKFEDLSATFGNAQNCYCSHCDVQPSLNAFDNSKGSSKCVQRPLKPLGRRLFSF